MRLFIALRLSDEMLNALTGAQVIMRKNGVKGNFTPPDNMHITLAFIGEYGDPEKVYDAVQGAAFEPFAIKLNGIGSFGDLWWAGIGDSEPLGSYAAKLRRALAAAGIPYDRKKFSPHITLLRRAEGAKMPGIELPPAEMTADSVLIMRSDRGKHGMIYTELYRVNAGNTVE